MELSAVLRQTFWAHPVRLYILAGAATLPLLAGLWSAGLSRRLGVPVLRSLVVLLLGVATLGPALARMIEARSALVMLDASNSVTGEMRRWMGRLLQEQLGLGDSDPASVFAGRPVLTTVGRGLALLLSDGGCAPCLPQRTDLEAALRQGLQQTADPSQPLVLVTDGWENGGDALAAARALRAAQRRVYILTPPGARGFADVAVAALEAPGAVAEGAGFTLSATLANFNPVAVRGTLSLYENGRLLEVRPVVVGAGEQREVFVVRAQKAGLSSYRVRFAAADRARDAWPEDDVLERLVGVGARRHALILTRSARAASLLETVARRLGFVPTVLDPRGRGLDLRAADYRIVILNNVARADFSAGAQAALAAYVKAGGSLVMVGGDRSFGLGGWAGSPVAQVLPVVMEPPRVEVARHAVVLLIDKSGSMGRNDKLAYAKAAARTVTKSFKDDDLVSVVGFDSQPFVVVPLEPLGQSRGYFDQMVERLRARGKTYLLPALEMAGRMLAGAKASLRHVVILTDGRTGGTEQMYYDLVSRMRREGDITVSAIAIGREPNLPLLKSIVQYGGGALYQTDNPKELPQLVLQDLRPQPAGKTLVERSIVPYSVKPDRVLGALAGHPLAPLKGYVATKLRPAARLDVFAENAGRRIPIVASWHYGKGRALAVTTDASGRWSGPWIERGVFSPVWNGILDWLAPGAASAPKLDIAIGYGAGRIRLEAIDYAAGGRTPLKGALVTMPQGDKRQVALDQRAPGEFTASFAAPRPGVYTIELQGAAARTTALAPLGYALSPAVAAEIPRPEPNYLLLERIARMTDGSFNPRIAALPGLQRKVAERTSLTRYFVVAAMLLLVAEALLRRRTLWG